MNSNKTSSSSTINDGEIYNSTSIGTFMESIINSTSVAYYEIFNFTTMESVTENVITSTSLSDSEISNFTPILNITESSVTSNNNVANSIVFYLSVVLSVIAGIISIFGNGLVLYASTTKRDRGRFLYVNLVVKNLALSDFLFGLIGMPCAILYWYWGKKHHFS